MKRLPSPDTDKTQREVKKTTKIVKLTLTTNNVRIIDRLPKILTFDPTGGRTSYGSRC